MAGGIGLFDIAISDRSSAGGEMHLAGGRTFEGGETPFWRCMCSPIISRVS